MEQKTTRSYPNDQAQNDAELAAMIIEQAVDDWIALNYGAHGSIMHTCKVIYRAEVLSFFRGAWFEFLLSFALPEYSPQEIRAKLKIAEPER